MEIEQIRTEYIKKFEQTFATDCQIQFGSIQHKKKIRTISVSSDNKYIITGSIDKSMILWNLETRRSIIRLGNKDSQDDEEEWDEEEEEEEEGQEYSGYDNSYERSEQSEHSDQEEKENEEKPKKGINCLAITPNNKFVISVNEKENMIVWNLKTKQPKIKFDKNVCKFVRKVAIDPESKYFVTGGRDGNIKLWNFEKKDYLTKFPLKHKKGITALEISSNGNYMVSASNDKTIVLWDFPNRVVLKTFEGHEEGIWALAISPDSKIIASGSIDKCLKFWDIEKKVLLHEFEDTHEASITSVAFTANGKYLVSGSADNTIKVWKVSYYKSDKKKKDKTEEELKEEKQKSKKDKNDKTPQLYHHFTDIHQDGVFSLATTPDNKFIVAGSGDGRIKLLSIPDKNEVETFDGAHESGILSVSVSSEGRYIVSGSDDNSIKIWDSEKKEMKRHIENADTDCIYSVMLSSDCKYIASASGNGNLKVWEFEGEAPLFTVDKAHKDRIMTIAISKDSSTIYTGSNDCTIKIWSIEAKKNIHTFQQAHKGEILAIQLTYDDQFLISGSEDRSMKIWNLAQKKFEYQFENAHTDTIYAVTTNSKYIISGSSDRTIKIWDIRDKKLYHHFKDAHLKAIYWLALSTDGKYIVSASADSTMKLWNIETKQELYHFDNAHDDGICQVTLSSDKSTLVSGSFDKTIKIWRLESKSILAHIKEVSDSTVKAIALSGNGETLVSVDGSNVIKVWTLKDNTIQFEYSDKRGAEINIISVAISSNGEYVAYGTTNGSAKVLDIKKKDVTNKSIGEQHKGAINAIVITNDDSYFITGSQDKSIILWKVKSGSVHTKFNEKHHEEVLCLAVSSDDLFLVSGSADRSMKLWDLDHMQVIRQFDDAHNDPVSAVAITNDIKYIVSGGSDGTLRSWDLKTGNMEYNYKWAHDYSISSISIHPNSRYIVTGSHDKSWKMWLLDNKEPIHSYDYAHEEQINTVAISQKGDFFATCSDDKTIKLWKIPSIMFCSKNFSIYLGVFPTFKDEHDLMILPYNFTQMHDFFLRVYNNLNEVSKAEVDETYKTLSSIVAKKTLFDEVKTEKFFKNLEKMDNFGNLPFDYLIGHEHLRNTIKVNFLKYEKKNNLPNFMKIMFEIKSRFLRMLKSETKSNFTVVITFLKLCLDEFDEDDIKKDRLAENYKRPEYGVPTNKLIKSKSAQMNEAIQNQLMKEVNEHQSQKLKFYRTTWPLDLHLHSEESYELLDFLGKQNKRFFFETRFILLILDYFWKRAKRYQFIFFLLHSGFMGLFTYNCVNSENPMTIIQWILLGYTGFLFLIEFLQNCIDKFDDFFDFWNINDFICYGVIGAVEALTIWELKPDLIPYLKTIGLFSGYFRWIGYLRIFDGMRGLIRTLIEIIKDMKNLVIIIIFTVSAYSAILESFNYGGSSNYYNNIYNAYLFLYDSQLTTEPELGLKAITMIFPFVINVIFLNMLINIMGDTFDKLQEKSLFADNNERLKLILEIVRIARFLRCFKRKASEFVAEDDVKPVSNQIEVKKSSKSCCKCCKRSDKKIAQTIPLDQSADYSILATSRTTERLKSLSTKNLSSSTLSPEKPKKSLAKQNSITPASATPEPEGFQIDTYVKKPEKQTYYLMLCENETGDVENDWIGKMNYLTRQIDQTKSSINMVLKTFEATRKELKSEMAAIRENNMLQISLIQSNVNFIAKKNGKVTDCTVDTTGLVAKLQECYYCVTCSMSICVECTQECHQSHTIRKEASKEFFCTCALKYQECKRRAKCTYKYTGRKYCDQLSWFCKDCLKEDNQCLCTYCKDNCHKGHNLVLKEDSGDSFCDCPEICQKSCLYRKDYIKQREDEEKKLKLEKEGLKKKGKRGEDKSTEDDSDDDDDTPRSVIPKNTVTTNLAESKTVKPEDVKLPTNNSNASPRREPTKLIESPKKDDPPPVKCCSVEDSGTNEMYQEGFYCPKCDYSFCKECEDCHKGHGYKPEDNKKFSCQCYFNNERCLKRNFCTLKVTGATAFVQLAFTCKTCSLPPGVVICAFCVKSCHSAHNTQKINNIAKSYCDCSKKCPAICKYAKYLKDNE